VYLHGEKIGRTALEGSQNGKLGPSDAHQGNAVPSMIELKYYFGGLEAYMRKAGLMISIRQIGLFLILVSIVAANGALNSATGKEREFFLATASAGGTYYPVGVALAALTKAKLKASHGIGMTAINSAGSGENIQLLRDNEAQFAILQGLFGYYARHGKGPFAKAGPQNALRAVTMLWQNVEQFSIHAQHSKSGTMADLATLRGKAMALDKKNSGTLVSNRFLLGNLGIDIDRDFDLIHLGYGPSADALQRGEVVGMGTPAGVPTGAVSRIKAAMGNKISILRFTAAQARKADGGLELWTQYTIPANTYPEQSKPIETIAQPNILAVRADVDAEAVYRITKAIYENLPLLRSMHAAATAMDLKKALIGLPLPLHPGAARYYEETGLEIAPGLIPN
jgi:TRAP transporter TAXI family solute receptor